MWFFLGDLVLLPAAELGDALLDCRHSKGVSEHVRGDAAADAGAPAQDQELVADERVALPGRGSTAFGSKKVSQGAVSGGAPFNPLNQRL